MSQEITINVGTVLTVQNVEETTEIVAPLDTDLIAMGRGPETVHTTVGDFKAPLLELVNQSVIGSATPSSSPTGTELVGQSYRVSNTTGAEVEYTNFLDSNGDPVTQPDKTSGYLMKNSDGWVYVDNTAQADTSNLVPKADITNDPAASDPTKVLGAGVLAGLAKNGGSIKTTQQIDSDVARKSQIFTDSVPNIPDGFATGFFLNADGSESANANFKTVGFISVVKGDVFYYKGNSTPSAYACIGYDDAGVKVASILGIGTYSTPTKIVISEGISKIKACSKISVDFQFFKSPIVSKVSVDGLTEVDSDVARNSSNIDDILNALPKEDAYYEAATELQNGYLNSAGAFVSSANWRVTPYKDVTPGKVIKYQGYTVGGTSSALFGYKYDYTDPENPIETAVLLIGSVDYSASLHSISIPIGVTKVRASARMLTGDIFSLQLIKQVPAPIDAGGSIVNYNNLTKPTTLTWNPVGTSITWYDQQPLGFRGYQTQVMDVIKFASIRHYGYSGACLTETNPQETTHDVILRHKNEWASADVWTLECPTNDFRLNKELGTSNDYINNTGDLTFYGGLRVFVDTVFTKSPSAKLFFITDPQRNNSSWIDGDDNVVPYDSRHPNQLGYYLDDYCEAMRWVANYESIPMVDIFKEGVINMKNLGVYLKPDLLHPNEDGYTIMAKKIIQTMLEVF